MNRRLFATKAAGFFAAIGTAMGMKARAEAVETPPKGLTPQDYRMPKRANVMYLGYEVQLSSHLAFGEPILFGIVTHKYINKDGAKTQEVEMHRLADLDCSKWNSAIGTFS